MSYDAGTLEWGDGGGLRKYRIVIFDFDGTLADSFDVFLEAWQAATGRFGFKSLAEHDLGRLRGYSARQVIAEIGLPWWKIPAVARFMRQFMRERIEQVKVFDGVDEILRELRSAGVSAAIVTSNSRENVEHVLGHERLAMVDHLACGASLFGKASKIRSVLRAAAVVPPAALCVGDEVRDAEVAVELGLDFAAVSWGYTDPTRLESLPGVKLCRSAADVLALMAA